MPTSYSTLLGLALPVTGELSGTWGDEVNNYITQYLDSAVAGAQTISGSQTAVTLSRTTNAALSQAGAGATGSSQYQIINCTGNPASALTVTVPSASKVYLVLNNTSTNQTVTVKGAATTGVTVAAARSALIAWNGTDFELVATDDASKLNGVLAVANGGTGATSLTGYVYGNGTSAFTASTSIPNSATTATSANTASAIVARDGSGNFSAGTITATLSGTATQVSNNLTLNTSGTGLSGSATFNGASAQTFTVASNATSANTASTIVARDASGNFSAGTITGTLSGNATNVSGVVAVANGGTGLSSTPANGALDIGNGSGFTRTTLTAGSGVSITNGAGAITISAAGSGGTVTSVSGTGTVNGISLSGTVTSSGSLTLGGSLSGVNLATQVTGTLPIANGGTGATDAATARSNLGAGTGNGTVTSVSGTGTVQGLTLSGSVTSSGSLTLGGSLSAVSLTSQVSGTLPVANGGTGATTLAANNVLLGNGTSALQTVAPGSSGNVLMSNGTTWTSAAASSGALTLLQTITVSGNPSSVDLETGIGSTYNFYLVTYTDVTPNTGAAFLNLRMKLNGSYRTSGYYTQGVGGYSSGSSALAYGAGNESGITLTLSTVTTNTGQGAHGEVWFSNPTSTTAYKMMNWAGGYLESGSGLVNLQGSSGQFTGGVGNTALTGVQFIFTSSRTFASGIFRLYGLANS